MLCIGMRTCVRTHVSRYQGESNAMDPLGYQCLQRAMVADWRKTWQAVGSDPNVPFLFVQLSAWPLGMNGGPLDEMLPVFRYIGGCVGGRRKVMERGWNVVEEVGE